MKISVFLEKAAYFCELSNPYKILEKGYSITTKNGKIVNSITDVKPGDVIFTRLKDGQVISKSIENEE